MNRYIPAIITGFAVTPFLVLQPVLAQTPDLLTARQSVVLVQNEAGVRQGTGFIVSGNNGTYSVLTAGHVVQERQPPNGQLRVVTVTGENIPVVAEVIPGRDLALLQFSSNQQYRAINILSGNIDELPLPTRIFVLGYPATGGREPEILGGNISSRQPSPRGSGVSIFHTAPTVRGISGSPVLTERGEVVGIHVGRDDQGGVREAIPLDQERYKQIVSSVFIRLARNNLEAGNYAEAITSIEQGIKQSILSNSLETDEILAYAYFAQGNNEEARRISRRISSSNANAALLLGAISYRTGDYINAISNANEVVRLDNRNLGNYALAIIGLSESANNPSQASLLSANSNTERAVRSLPSSAFINFAHACVRRRSLDNEGSARFANEGNRNNRPIPDIFLRIVIPSLQETVIKDCLDNLPVQLPSQFGRYRIAESINLESGATSIAVSRDNQFVAVGMRNGTVSVYNLQTRSRTGIFSSGQPNTAISSVAFSPNGQEIAIASGSGEVRIFNVNRSERHRYSIDGGVSPLIIFRDNSSLFVGNRNGTLKIVRDQQTIVAENHDGGISSLTLSPNSNLLVSGGVNGTIRVWNAADLTPVDNYQAHQRGVQSLAFSADGNQIISAGLDDVIKSCSWQTKECSEVTRSSSPEGISSLAVAINGHVAFSNLNFLGSGNNAIFLQNTRSGESFGDLSGHTRQINALAYTSDGRFFVSGSDDQTLIIWEVK
jgi:WD40 repeat protein